MTVNVLGRRFPAVATYVAALSAALLLLIITVAAALWQTNRGVELNVEVRESLAQRANLRLLIRALQDVETGQRGYLLTGNADYLQPYLAARDDVGRQLDLLEAAARTAERRTELERMRELSTEKLEELATTIALRHDGRTGEMMRIVNSDRGRVVMDELRQLIAIAEAREETAVIERMAEVDRSADRLRLVVILAGVLLFGVGALLVITVRNAMSDLAQSRDAARAAHERVMQEMGAREHAEEKVRQMQKMEAIGQLTGGVAHDFNNMLAVIISALQLAQRRMARGETAEISRFIDAAMDGARRAATLTSRLLAFARRAPLTPTVLDPNRVIAGMSELLRRTLGERIDFETVLAGGAWRINVDANELENAIVNICVNARDAMPEGGKLTIESANAYLDQTYADANQDVTPGQYVMIAITDTGGGMPAEIKAKAFEPFFTTKEVGKGTGLGLAHVHGFLKQSGGHAAIYSEIGVGTTLKLYMPRTQMQIDGAAQQSLAPPTDELPTGDAGTIVLVVEDEERVRNLSVASLRDLGYTVIHAENGVRALEVLAEKPGVSLLFTDIVMPGMSGRKLSDEARALYPTLKVLYTTGYTRNAIIHNGVVDADARLLMKPYSLSDLARKVRAVLDE